jgi:4-oxalocrotonate tautomerase
MKYRSVIIMPVVHVNVWKGFEQEKVNYLIENITNVFVDLDIPKEAVEVLVHEVPQSHWGIGGVPASEKFKDTEIPGWNKK